MKTQIKRIKKAGLIIDNSLEKYKNISLFPEKLAKAKAELAKYGIPGKLKSASEAVR